MKFTTPVLIRRKHFHIKVNMRCVRLKARQLGWSLESVLQNRYSLGDDTAEDSSMQIGSIGMKVDGVLGKVYLYFRVGV